MNTFYILFNIILLGCLIFLLKWMSAAEAKDVYLLNNYFEKISTNNQCLDYLQLITNIPYWRFCLISSFFYTGILFILYIISGNTITNEIIFIIWLLFIFNAVFLYKTIATRDFHYVCKNNCKPLWVHQD